MTPEDHVKSVHVLTTRNPQPLVTDYYFTPRSGVARVAQRIRLAQSQYVFGFALMSDDSAVDDREARFGVPRRPARSRSFSPMQSGQGAGANERRVVRSR